MASEGLREFGNHVREARVRKGWTLETLAMAALNNPGRKGYVSQIENGKRPLSALTIGNFARVLDLPAEVTRPLLFAPAQEDEVTREDRLAETLIRRNDADPAPPQAEALVIALAYEFAGGKFLELSTAYTGLRNALQAAAEMRAELARLHNMDARLAAVLQRVEDLNNQGLRDAAGDELDAAIKAKEAELDALQDAALTQDRLRNRPADAAARLIKRLKDSAPAGGLFAAIHRLTNETRQRGDQQSDPFDLALALDLAKANNERAKGPQVLAASNDLGNCLLALGERQTGGGHLTRARTVFADDLSRTSRQRNPNNWAISQNNLGIALAMLGERTGDLVLLKKAVTAHRAALTVRTPETTPTEWANSKDNLGNDLQALGKRTGDRALLKEAVSAHLAALTIRTPETTPMDWAISQNNLGLSLRWLAGFTRDKAMMEEAAVAYAACLTKRSRETAPFLWAQTQWNLADLALARHVLAPDPGHLTTARHHLDLAREVFTQEGNDHQLAECDRLQAQIEAS